MAVVSSFPLFNLPLLPFNEVISNMPPVELLWMSLVSKKTANLVKERQTIDLEVIEDEPTLDCKIICKDQNGSKFLSIVMKNIEHIDQFNNYLTQNIDDQNVAIKVENDNITAFLRDEVEGYHAIVSVLCNVFRVRSFYIDAEELDTNLLPKESKNRILKMAINAIYSDKMVFNYILDNFKDVPELKIQGSGYEYQHNVVRPLKDNCYCVINNAYWFAFKEINKLMKCIKIKLWDLNWTSEEMNQFLKKWLESTMMKMVIITVEEIDLKKAIEGLQVTRQRKRLKYRGWIQGMRDCFKIQRNDGVSAYLWRHGKNFVMQND